MEELTRAQWWEAREQDEVIQRINEAWHEVGADGVITSVEGQYLCEATPQHLEQVEQGLEVTRRLALKAYEVDFMRQYLTLSKASAACLPGGASGLSHLKWSG